MKQMQKTRSVLLKAAVLAVFILLVLAVQTADADAASYEFVRISDLDTEVNGEVEKTKLKSGGYIWIGEDINGMDHHDVYYQKKEGGDIYIILDFFDANLTEYGYSDILITNGQKFYYTEIGYGGNFVDGYIQNPKFNIYQLDLGNGRKHLATAEGKLYQYGYRDRFVTAGYYNGYLYYSLEAPVNFGEKSRLYKLNVKTGKTTRVYKNFAAFPATGNGRYIYGYTIDSDNCEKDKFAIYDCKQGKKVRSLSKDVYAAKVMNGKLYFAEAYTEEGKTGVFKASLSGKDRTRILYVRAVGDMVNNRIYYGVQKKDGSMSYRRYNVKSGNKSNISESQYLQGNDTEVAYAGRY